MEFRIKLFIGMDRTTQGLFPFFHVDLVPQINDFVHSLVVHVCATVTYLNKWVIFEFRVYVVQLSELGLGGKTSSFLA